MIDRRISSVAVLSAVVGVTAAIAAGSGADVAERAKPTCAVSADGRTLTVAAVLTTFIEREADQIVVGDLSGAVTCSGGAPTVTTVDTIEIGKRVGKRFPEIRVDLQQGGFFPGATDEGDGSSEIEIEVDRSIDVLIDGTGNNERLIAGSIPGGGAGINLSGTEKKQRDADLTIAKPSRDLFMRIEGSGGDDVVSANGGPGFKGPLAYGRASILVAGGGDDRVFGTPGKDVIEAEGGTDTVRALAGNDDIDSSDSGGDVIICGPGEDELKADPGDERRGCEQEDLR